MAQQDSKAPLFAVGDRVRIARDHLPTKLGTEFTVTEVRDGYTDRGFVEECGHFYYLGDPNRDGVWEKFLERVTP